MADDFDSIHRRVRHRLAAWEATNALQKEIVFDDKWRALVENTVYALIEDGYRKGADSSADQ